MLCIKLLKYLLSFVVSGRVLVDFCKNIPEIVLSFMIDGLKLAFFGGQILNSIVAFILRPRKYGAAAPTP